MTRWQITTTRDVELYATYEAEAESEDDAIEVWSSGGATLIDTDEIDVDDSEEIVDVEAVEDTA